DSFGRERGLALGPVDIEREHPAPHQECDVRVGGRRPPVADLLLGRLALDVLAPGRENRALTFGFYRDRVEASALGGEGGIEELAHSSLQRTVRSPKNSRHSRSVSFARSSSIACGNVMRRSSSVCFSTRRSENARPQTLSNPTWCSQGSIWISRRRSVNAARRIAASRRRR